MKILGIFAGRPRQVSEFWLQTALKAAADEGAEVELINLRDLKIHPCTGCRVCHKDRFRTGEGGECIFKDDMPWVDEKILECDGMIVCMPCFENSPPSEFKLLLDRLGPSHDVVAVRDGHEKLLAAGKKGVDERWFKKRPCAFISHGGSEWKTLGLPVMSVMAVPLGMKIVDLINFSFNMHCAMDEKNIERVRRLGRTVAKNMGLPEDQMKYMGDFGHCPMCHNSTMVLGKKADDVTCAVCGIKGTISVEDGEIKISYDPKQFELSHVTDSGKYIHLLDMNSQGKEEMRKWREVAPQMEKLIRDGTSYFTVSKPDRK